MENSLSQVVYSGAVPLAAAILGAIVGGWQSRWAASSVANRDLAERLRRERIRVLSYLEADVGALASHYEVGGQPEGLNDVLGQDLPVMWQAFISWRGDLCSIDDGCLRRDVARWYLSIWKLGDTARYMARTAGVIGAAARYAKGGSKGGPEGSPTEAFELATLGERGNTAIAEGLPMLVEAGRALVGRLTSMVTA